MTNALPRKLHCRNVITLLLLGAAALRPPSVTAGGTSLLADLQYRAWRYFEENVSSNGLIRDHLSDPTLTSAEAAGFYLTAICVAERNGWIPREEAAARTRACLEAYAHLPRFHGFLAHYYDIGTGEVVPLVHEKDDGADALQTALFIAGALTARAWFDRGTEDERRVQELATRLYNEVEWNFLLLPADSGPAGGLLSRYWSPHHGFAAAVPLAPDTHLEATLAYVLAIGSPTHPIPAECWYNQWARRYRWLKYDGKDFIACPPLRSHILPHLWLDLSQRRDRFADYLRNSRLAALADRAFCLTHLYPSRHIWGLSCCFGPQGYFCYGYPPETDRATAEGVLCPAASLSSALFLPGTADALAEVWRRETPPAFYGRYGFAEAISPKLGWHSEEYSAANLGMLLAALENLHSGAVRAAFMRNQCIQAALEQIGFVGVVADFEPADQPYASFRPRGTTLALIATRSGRSGHVLELKAIRSAAGAGVDIYPRRRDFSDFDYLSVFVTPPSSPAIRLQDISGETEKLEVASTVNCPASDWQRVYYDLTRVSRVDLRRVEKVTLLCPVTNSRSSRILLDDVILVNKLDTEPPAPVPVTSVNPTRMPGEVVLNWKPSGDDGDLGTCFRYLVRYSRRPIRSVADFRAAADGGPRAPHDWIPASATNWHVVGLQPGEKYYFAVCAEDLAGNLSALLPSFATVLPGRARLASFRLDDFEWTSPAGDHPRWSARPAPATVEVTTRLSLKGGGCLQIRLAGSTSTPTVVTAHLDVNDLSRFRWLSFWARGRAAIRVGLVDRHGTLLDCGQQEVLRDDAWSPLFYRLPQSPEFQRRRVTSLVLTVIPRETGNRTLYLDELYVSREKMP